ncbi:MazG family protein [Actinopolyspora erythraea]|uniref:MazG family protein n=1 Tax=Actinopolyspora erythraea TaxID=414996 RepID=A0A223RVQ9_9ACTN|nr:MazG family protein [Actinopolyspora erythraea]ASU79945.1 MazG family protein [Actinopolyspora erythraea]
MDAVGESRSLVNGCAVVLVDDRLGDVVPAEAVPWLRGAVTVYADAGLAESTRDSLGATTPPECSETLRRARSEAVVLVAADDHSRTARELLAAGAAEVRASPPAGVELLDAVTVMDRLRSPGGCPWDAGQTHESLRTYLVEETYELLEALEHSDRGAMREELGDVLLQVLFHARVAAEHETDPFDVDAVAAELVSKLVSRHPHVFATDDSVHDAESQHARWEELKQREKQRESAVDGVAHGQPAAALAAKLVQRAERAGIPGELIGDDSQPGAELFEAVARARRRGLDPEDTLRAASLAFDGNVRAAERRARAAGADAARLSESDWRKYWPESGETGGIDRQG